MTCMTCKAYWLIFFVDYILQLQPNWLQCYYNCRGANDWSFGVITDDRSSFCQGHSSFALAVRLSNDCHGTAAAAGLVEGEAPDLRVLLHHSVHLCPEPASPHAVHYEYRGATGVAGNGLIYDRCHIICSHASDVPAASRCSLIVAAGA